MHLHQELDMLECLIVGDSLAVGVANVRKECVAFVQSGINSQQWLDRNIQRTPLTAKHVIISLGSNDPKSIETEEQLRTIRSLAQAQRVYWVLPGSNFPTQRKIIWRIANDYHDVILKTEKMQADNVHPTPAGYKEIARASE
jgi:lysophospholipase L1-like esterase